MPQTTQANDNGHIHQALPICRLPPESSAASISPNDNTSKAPSQAQNRPVKNSSQERLFADCEGIPNCYNQSLQPEQPASSNLKDPYISGQEGYKPNQETSMNVDQAISSQLLHSPVISPRLPDAREELTKQLHAIDEGLEYKDWMQLRKQLIHLVNPKIDDPGYSTTAWTPNGRLALDQLWESRAPTQQNNPQGQPEDNLANKLVPCNQYSWKKASLQTITHHTVGYHPGPCPIMI